MARHRADWELIGLDPDAVEDPREERLIGIEWQLSTHDPDRTCNTYAMMNRFRSGGQPAVDEFFSELDAKRAELFAEYEQVAGHPHPDAPKK